MQPVSMDPNARYGMAALHQGGPGGMMQALKQFGPAPGAKKMLEWEVARNGLEGLVLKIRYFFCKLESCS